MANEQNQHIDSLRLLIFLRALILKVLYVFNKNESSLLVVVKFIMVQLGLGDELGKSNSLYIYLILPMYVVSFPRVVYKKPQFP